MTLEWIVLAVAAAAEAMVVVLLSLPGENGLRKRLIPVTKYLLTAFHSVLPLCLFLMMDIYWNYKTEPSCQGHSCSPFEHLMHQLSIMTAQRNAVLIAAALIFYWLLYSINTLVVSLEDLKKLKGQD